MRRSTPHAVVRDRARAGLAGTRRLGHEVELAEGGRQRLGFARGGDDVEVLAGLGHPPRAARDLDPFGRRVLRAAPRRSARATSSAVESKTARLRAPVGARRDRLEDRLLRLRAEAVERREAARPRRRSSGPRARLSRARRTACAPASVRVPADAVISTSPAGNFFFSLSVEGIDPVSISVTIFSSSVLPIPASS